MDYWPSVAAWKEYIPHALLVSVPDCAHYIMIEQPERFNGELTAFLMDIRSNAAPSGESRITPPGFMERLPRDTDHDA
jgi:hypothetical protein